ncbi:DUF3082 domain-containing protein [Nostoc sp. UHCC 0302]|uniref:DUF3082 domain-containing protein n=1 Tax=Nostoc sp. UHCC 0302 TaxID=3134896 RepID=UPI00311CB8B7
MSDPNLTQPTESQAKVPSSPLRCVTGAVISGGMGYAMYSLMISIATNFASKPIHSSNLLVLKISSAVRTLVVGVVALGSGIFSLVAIGLLALAVQLLVQQFTNHKSTEN